MMLVDVSLTEWTDIPLPGVPDPAACIYDDGDVSVSTRLEYATTSRFVNSYPRGREV